MAIIEFEFASASDGGGMPTADSSELSAWDGTYASTVSTPTLDGPYCYRLPASGWIRQDAGASYKLTERRFFAHWIVRVNVYGTGASHPYLAFNNSATPISLFQLRVDVDGELLIQIGTTPYETGFFLSLDTNYFVEFSIWQDPFTFTLYAECRIRQNQGDTPSVFQTSDPRTSALSIRYLYAYASAIGKGDSATNFYVDNMLFSNDTGGPPNNSWPGPITVERLLPTGEGNYDEWINEVGGNADYTKWNEVPANDDAGYNHHNAASLKTQSSIIADPAYNDTTHEAAAVVTQLAGRIASGTDGTCYALTRVASTDYLKDVTATLPTANYIGQIEKRIDEMSPNSGVQWTKTEITNMEVGARLDAAGAGSPRDFRVTQIMALVLVRPIQAAGPLVNRAHPVGGTLGLGVGVF